MTFAGYILRNSFREPIKSTFVLISVAAAFFVFCVLSAFIEATGSNVELSSAERLIILNSASRIKPLPVSHAYRVSSIEGVRSVTFATWFGGYYRDPSDLVTTLAVDENTYFDVYPEVRVSDKDRKAFALNRRGVLVGAGLADKYGWARGDLLVLQSNIWDAADGTRSWEFEVLGVHLPSDPRQDSNYLLMHYDYLDQRRVYFKGFISWIVVRCESSEIANLVSTLIDNLFSNSAHETVTDPEEALARSFLQQFGDLRAVLLIVAGGVFISILLISTNSLAGSVRNRSRELAILKAVGYKQEVIVAEVVATSFIHMLSGAILGIILSVVAVLLVKDAGAAAFLSALQVTAGNVGSSISIALILSLIAAVLPALNALDISVAGALSRA